MPLNYETETQRVIISVWLHHLDFSKALAEKAN